MKAAVMRMFGGTAADWNAVVASLPGAHLLQTWEWAEFKSAYGWIPMPLVWESAEAGSASDADPPATLAAAMVLKKNVIAGGFARRLCLLYVPKGPVLDWSARPLMNGVLDDLQALGGREGAVFVKVDPDVVLGTGIPGAAEAGQSSIGQDLLAEFGQRRWLFSEEQIQFRNTVVVDLSASEEQLLARMKQKTRYNIRLASRNGVHVRAGAIDELPALYRLYAETATRDGFVIRNQEYYSRLWTTFMNPLRPKSEPAAECLIAEIDGEVAAAIFVFYFAERAYYLQGMSRPTHREKMPNYLLQWEAMRLAKTRGCRTYDLWGAPDDFNEEDPLWGVYRFKEGFDGEVVRTVGAWDFPVSRFWYPAYTRVVPRILDLMRWRGRAHTREDAAPA